MVTNLTPYQQLFNYYINLQSKEMKEEIQGYKKLSMKGIKFAIKVIFKNGEWLHVYKTNSDSVEWY